MKDGGEDRRVARIIGNRACMTAAVAALKPTSPQRAPTPPRYKMTGTARRRESKTVGTASGGRHRLTHP